MKNTNKSQNMLSEGRLRQETTFYESIYVNYQNRHNLSRMVKLGGAGGRVGVHRFTRLEHDRTF